MHRTYVRRRVALVAAALVLAAALGGRVAGALTPAPGGGPVPARAAYVVREGDTLWAIASEVEPGGDPRETVDEIERLNGGLSGSLVVGHRLILPVSG